MTPPIKKILVVRNDKLGDFVLSFPALRMLKQSLPEYEIHVLVPEYTRPIAELNSDIDKILLDPGQSQGWSGLRQLLASIRHENYTALVTLFSTTRIGLCCWLARIPVRIAPATKLAQLFYNHRIRQRRSSSAKPEFAYNTELAEYFLKLQQLNTAAEPHPPYLHVPENVRRELLTSFTERYGISREQMLVFIHPGSGGSAVNLSLEQYAQLANKLRCPRPFTVVISCAPAEEAQARKLSDLISVANVVYVSDQGLQRFVQHISLASVFISGSTGPLHIAGSLNRPTAGFYPNRRSATSLRWQTLSGDDRRMEFSPPRNAESEDMSQIDMDSAAKSISDRLSKLYAQDTRS